MSELTGKIALVTGAGSGMGAAISQKLAERGATVAVTDANLGAAEKVVGALVSAGLKASAYRYDVTKWEEARSTAGAVESELGGIDILVNNAGVSRLIPFLEIDEAEWNRLMNINLKGVFLTLHAEQSFPAWSIASAAVGSSTWGRFSAR